MSQLTYAGASPQDLQDLLDDPEALQQDGEPARKRRKVDHDDDARENMEKERWKDHLTLAQIEIELVRYKSTLSINLMLTSCLDLP